MSDKRGRYDSLRHGDADSCDGSWLLLLLVIAAGCLALLSRSAPV